MAFEDDQPRTPPQMRKLMALFHQLDVNDADDQRIIIAHILGTPKESRKKLTKTAAGRVIDEIESWFLTPEYGAENRILDILNTAALQQATEQEPDE
jgi:hypothetical protein